MSNTEILKEIENKWDKVISNNFFFNYRIIEKKFDMKQMYSYILRGIQEILYFTSSGVKNGLKKLYYMKVQYYRKVSYIGCLLGEGILTILNEWGQ